MAAQRKINSLEWANVAAEMGQVKLPEAPQRKMYKKIPINGQHEVIGMSGDIALYQGKPVVHTHMIVGSPDGTTRAGHILDAYVSPTLEVMVTVDPIAMHKRFDPETDLTLIDPALK